MRRDISNKFNYKETPREGTRAGLDSTSRCEAGLSGGLSGEQLGSGPTIKGPDPVSALRLPLLSRSHHQVFSAASNRGWPAEPRQPPQRAHSGLPPRRPAAS